MRTSAGAVREETDGGRGGSAGLVAHIGLVADAEVRHVQALDADLKAAIMSEIRKIQV